MNLQEQLRIKKSELAALKDKIAAGDAEAIKAGEALAEAIKGLEASIAEAEKANNLLKMIGNENPSAPAEEEGMKGLIARAKSVDTRVKGWSVNATFGKKAATDTVVAPQVATVENNIANPYKKVRRVADLFGSATISGNAVTYYVQNAIEGDAAITAQGAKKAQISTSFTPVTKALSKVTAYAKETTEMLEDAPFLASAVEEVVEYKIKTKENNHIVTEIVNTSGIQSVTYGNGGDADTLAEAILLGKTRIAQLTDYEADVVLINPADMYKLTVSKDANGQYLGGGFFTGAYGNGNYTTPVTIWGLPVYESAEVTVGEPLVAAGKSAIKVYRKGDVDVKIFDQNEDDAIYNLVTILGEERLLVAVKDPNGVVKVSAK